MQPDEMRHADFDELVYAVANLFDRADQQDAAICSGSAPNIAAIFFCNSSFSAPSRSRTGRPPTTFRSRSVAAHGPAVLG